MCCAAGSRFRYAGVPDEVLVRAGACLSQPGGVPHNVVGRSDDLELIEINLPARFGTWDAGFGVGPRRRGPSVTIPATDSTPSPAGAASGTVAWLRQRMRALLLVAVLLVIWEIAVRLLGIKEYLLPPPTKIWSEFSKRSSAVMDGAWVTTLEILGGYLLAVVVSVPFALAVTLFALHGERRLSGGRFPADRAQDRRSRRCSSSGSASATRPSC